MDELREIHLKKDIFEIPRSFASLGFHSTIISGKFEVPVESEVTFIPTNNVHTNSIFSIIELGKIVKINLRENPDIFMFFHNNPYIPFVITLTNFFRKILSRMKKKTIWIIKSDWDGTKKIGGTEIGRQARNLFFSLNSFFVDFVTVETSCAFQIMRKYVDENKIVLFPDSFSHQYIEKQTYDSTIREPFILTVSRISREKGLHVLLSAFLNVREKFKDWELHIVGPIWDKKYYEELVVYINENNLASRVKFTFSADEKFLKQEYSRASIFCLPSIHESFGIVRMEAAASGIPVITSSAGCGSDFKALGMSVFENGNIVELSGNLELFMSNEEMRRETARIQFTRIKSFSDLTVEFIKKIDFEY
jgi:glycosyltransferase involved in cell wall biosynthesis